MLVGDKATLLALQGMGRREVIATTIAFLVETQGRLGVAEEKGVSPFVSGELGAIGLHWHYCLSAMCRTPFHM